MIGGSNLRSGMIETLFCDAASDVTDLEQFARDHDLKQGSNAYVIENGDVYIMQSNYTWVKQ